MSDHFKVKVNTDFKFDINLEDVSKLDIIEVSKANYHLLHNNKSYTAEVTSSKFNKKTYDVSVNNTIYNVNILNELDILVDKMGFATSAKKNITSILAPMPGLILEISVEVGQEITENTPLLILEAMKMENSINSPTNGVIKAIHSKKGDAVEKNQLIIEFE